MKFERPLTAEQQKLVEEHMRLVHWTVRRYITVNEQVCGLGYEDLCQEGSIALCYAAATYHSDAAKFNTYATTVIRNHLLDYCRAVAAQQKRYSPTSPDMPKYDDGPPDVRAVEPGFDETDAWLSQVYTDQIFEHGKRTYTGVAKLGIEALELKVKGYSGADIARLYQTNPNHVGAWISRAVARLRRDSVATDLFRVENGVR